ncbi:DUF2796 domain-containing protein [Variovorax ginsengisoli]|uniref:DUF2796 domain-containing protein n=1 Tax=Variovorax ginsengisoli TaxID=363844 RepID=A0ABT9S193_9BURK|nr:DUF2796 domain-containing protein [Variovorax ginsengisoli]MDP9898121.1 hypothetical protein [Variovorax ginsengisoli]
MTPGKPAVLFGLATLIGATLGVNAVFAQTQHAHVHGQLKLDIAVEGPTVVISMESPLDNIVGFERAPRTDAERQTVEDAAATLRAADKLFLIDPTANCKLGPVELQSAVLGWGKQATTAPADAHADLDATFAFNCTNATAAKFIDVGLFTAFKGPRQIDAQIATAQGQFQRTLKRPNARLAWGK